PAVYPEEAQVAGGRSGRAVSRDAVGVGQDLAVGGKGDRVDPLALLAGSLGAEQLPVFHVPEAQPVLAAEWDVCEELAVGRAGNGRVEGVVGVRPSAPEEVNQLAGGRIPQIDRAVAFIVPRQEVPSGRGCQVRNSPELELAKFLPGCRFPEPDLAA